MNRHDTHGKEQQLMTQQQTPPREQWDIRSGLDAPWVPWGGGTKARAKVLGEADGYTVTLIAAETGYRGTPHEHAHAEFFYLIDGTVRNQGVAMSPGDGYAAACGSIHSDFEVLTPSKYINIWRL
jgi:mannose-6-phosphate isomerase-like protein (cupin superfamily)